MEIQLIQNTQHERRTNFCFYLMKEVEPVFETFRVFIKNMMEKG